MSSAGGPCSIKMSFAELCVNSIVIVQIYNKYWQVMWGLEPPNSRKSYAPDLEAFSAEPNHDAGLLTTQKENVIY